MSKINLTIFCGGQSTEHEISIISASNILAALNSQKYQVFLIYINRQGEWLALPDYDEQAGPSQLSRLVDDKNNAVLVTPKMGAKGTPWLLLDESRRTIPCDLVFPVLHGPRGEDGRLQGLLELLQLPYVGCDALSAAMCMDKDISKRIVQFENIKTAPWIVLQKHSYTQSKLKNQLADIGYPCYVKPANMGSSVGISKVKTRTQLAKAINLAFQYDQKVIIEKHIEGREIECAVLGNYKPVAALPGEIIPMNAFYDYKAKYIDDNADKLDVPAKLDEPVLEAIQEAATHIYKKLECSGMARVDFFITKDNDIYFNEVNTIPGFTNISLYPKCWQHCGISYDKLLDELFQLAGERWMRPDQDQFPRRIQTI